MSYFPISVLNVSSYSVIVFLTEVYEDLFLFWSSVAFFFIETEKLKTLCIKQLACAFWFCITTEMIFSHKWKYKMNFFLKYFPLFVHWNASLSSKFGRYSGSDLVYICKFDLLSTLRLCVFPFWCPPSIYRVIIKKYYPGIFWEEWQ